MCKVQIGAAAPQFNCRAVVDGRFKDVSLASYTEANHWLILAFFPKAWSLVCPTEIKAFSARLEEFIYSRSCAVVFASTDSDHCLKAWNATYDTEGGLGSVHMPLISDCNHQLSRDYGVLLEDLGVAARALFIIDPKGIVRAITVNDVHIGRSVDETLRILDALIFKDEFGEGCPADWKKGDKGIDLSHRTDASAEPKKSWSDWARPKLTRAWSGNSQRSISSVSNLTGSRLRSDSTNSNMLSPPPFPLLNGSGLSSGQQSPLISPTSGMNMSGRRMENQLDEAIMQQRMENLAAALQNERQVEKPSESENTTPTPQSAIGVAN